MTNYEKLTNRPLTRCSALQAVRRIGRFDQARAAELVASVSFEESPTVADDVFSAIGKHGYLSHDDVTDVDRERLLLRLARLSTIDGYQVQTYLASLSAIHPETVLQLLKRRVMTDAEQPHANYRDLPDQWQEPLRFRDTTRFGDFLLDLLEWVADNIDDSRIHDSGELFKAVAVTFDDDVRATLDDVLEFGEARCIRAVGTLLAHAHRTFVWEHPDFVVPILLAAPHIDKDCLRHVRNGLARTMRSGGFGGPVGQPFPQDVEQRDRSRAVAATLDEGSPEWDFYNALAQTGEAAIRSEMDRDRRFLDVRDG
jgi:hypothetical protein